MAKKHWIYIKRGLSEDPKHRAQMGECIWLYMHIIDRADWETGVAYDWKDKDEAADMGMPVDTLRRQRQKLEELDYIRARQKQHSQDLYIMEWKNPRDYGSETKNPRNQGSHEQPPSVLEGGHRSPPSTVEGLNQGSNEGLNQGSNQVQAQVKTPTSTSESKARVRGQEAAPDFKKMTVAQAHKVWTLRMYTRATEFFPGSILWEYVDRIIRENQLTEKKIHDAAVAWVGRGYRVSNVQGILEWALNGVPTNGNSPTAATPAIDEKAVGATREMLDKKWDFTPAPPPDVQGSIKQLAAKRSVRR
jgi:hypothetical protein